MIRKLYLSWLIAALGILLLAAGVSAQGLDNDAELDGPTVLPVTQPVTATTPFTLTVLIPDEDGIGFITVDVPIMLQLSMSVTLGSNLTTTVVSTPTVDIVSEATTPDVEEDDAIEDEIESIPVATNIPTPVPTATPIPTPTPEALPTSTPIAADDETTDDEVVDETDEAVDEAVDEADTTPVPDEAGDEAGDEATEEATEEATTEPLDEAIDEAIDEAEADAGEDAGGDPVTIAPVCPDSRSVISSPGVNQVISGEVDIIGTAVHENFQYYKIEYAEGADPDNTGEYAFLTDSRIQISDGVLASFDSAELDNGTYTLRLSVVDNTGNFPPPCAVTVIVQN